MNLEYQWFDRYKPHQTDAIRSLLVRRDMPVGLAESLPDNGVLCFENGVLVACGFLRIIEGGFGLIDGFISDPEFEPELRHKVLWSIGRKLIALAKDSTVDLYSLFVMTSDESMVRRALTHGFQTEPMTLLSLSLKEGGGIWHS